MEMTVLPASDLPLGFRFRPTDEELVNYYLKGKIKGRKDGDGVIPDVDVCKWEPWELPGMSLIPSVDPEWFFFCRRDRKYPNGQRTNRATGSGYWKATGKDRKIKTKKEAKLIGTKKTLVFYQGRAPEGKRMNWVMHEYHADKCEDLNGLQDAFVLCRLFRKPEENGTSSKCDIVDSSEVSPTARKSIPDENICDEPFDSPTEEKLESDKQEIQQTTAAVVVEERQDQSDVVQSLQRILDASSDSPVENGTIGRNYMADQEMNASGLFKEPSLESLESLGDDYRKSLSTSQSFNIFSPSDGGYLDSVLLSEDNGCGWHILSGSSTEAAHEMFDISDIFFEEPFIYQTFVDHVENENETGIDIRTREPTNDENRVMPAQGTAPRRIHLHVTAKISSADGDQKEGVRGINCAFAEHARLPLPEKSASARSLRSRLGPKPKRLQVTKAETSHDSHQNGNALEVAAKGLSDNFTDALYSENSPYPDMIHYANDVCMSKDDGVMKVLRRRTMPIGAKDISDKPLIQQGFSKPWLVMFLAAITLLPVVLAVLQM